MVRFMIAGDLDYSEERPDTYVQMSPEDCEDFLRWLGYPATDFGFLEARDCAARCRRRLWPISRNMDPAIPSKTQRIGGRLLILANARPAGYLQARTKELLHLAERAGDGKILFS